MTPSGLTLASGAPSRPSTNTSYGGTTPSTCLFCCLASSIVSAANAASIAERAFGSEILRLQQLEIAD